MIKIVCNGCDKKIVFNTAEEVFVLQELIGEYEEDCDFNLFCSEDCRDILELKAIA